VTVAVVDDGNEASTVMSSAAPPVEASRPARFAGQLGAAVVVTRTTVVDVTGGREVVVVVDGAVVVDAGGSVVVGADVLASTGKAIGLTASPPGRFEPLPQAASKRSPPAAMAIHLCLIGLPRFARRRASPQITVGGCLCVAMVVCSPSSLLWV
jgi:hypothetical protein